MTAARRHFDPELDTSSRSELSLSDEWGTPDHLFQRLNARFRFDVDLAASDLNHRCEVYFTKERSSLVLEWDFFRAGFLNHPYSRGQCALWTGRARDAAVRHGVTVVCVSPVRTSEGWWHQNVQAPAGPLLGVTKPADNVTAYHYAEITIEVELIKGRVAFVGPTGAKSPARFSSAVIAYIGRPR